MPKIINFQKKNIKQKQNNKILLLLTKKSTSNFIAPNSIEFKKLQKLTKKVLYFLIFYKTLFIFNLRKKPSW